MSSLDQPVPSSLALSPLRRYWELQRRGNEEAAWHLLRDQWPAPLAPEGPQRREQRQLLDVWISEVLRREGLAAAQALLEQQQRGHGLPDGEAALEALLHHSRLGSEMSIAASALLQLLADNPRQPQLALELAETLALLGLLQPAQQLCRQALQLLPVAQRSRGHDLAALLAYRLGDRDSCYSHLFEAVALGSQDPLTLQFLCRLQTLRGHLDAAEASLTRLRELQIHALNLREQRLQLGLELASGLAADDLFDRLCAGLSGGLFEDGAELLALAPALLGEDAQLLALRDALLRQRQRQYLITRPDAAGAASGQGEAARTPFRRLGVLAPRYSPGSAAGLLRDLAPWLAAEGLELHWFATLAEDTAPDITALAGLERDEALALLRQPQLDGLIDLCGWEDGQRQDLLQARVAPLQLGWLANDFSLGLPQLDYLLVDRFQVPDLAEALLEGLLVLPGSFLALAQPLPPPPLRPAVGGALAVLAPAARLQPQALAAWAELLRAWPSQQLAFCHPSYGQERVWQRLLQAFAAEGIAAERLLPLPEAAQPVPTALLLDPWPWGDWRSALAALQQGVPVVCRRGTALHQRRTAGVLELLGLGSFVADDSAAYLAIADSLLTDRKLQSQLHGLIPQQLQASLLLQPAAFAHELMASLQGLKPAVANATGS